MLELGSRLKLVPFPFSYYRLGDIERDRLIQIKEKVLRNTGANVSIRIVPLRHDGFMLNTRPASLFSHLYEY